ncbi:prolyl oligopeptidase family-domain-containing protein [Fimicolochytrium jonesii]|uniref:prolyl oligopeptidase family-domain-containing protein n=1 Tax=Fimicolochytrium jonesii TaxID=1396493 RepID=UPI0022FEAD38|nr:prolyl oligopeptidase family-domain-containing protein [Fimicolochytrium jonesii]KAI8823014.1 prolyl oligopeptidase family-domain-containing protein [Fimicolochytrium jonesii]
MRHTLRYARVLPNHRGIRLASSFFGRFGRRLREPPADVPWPQVENHTSMHHGRSRTDPFKYMEDARDERTKAAYFAESRYAEHQLRKAGSLTRRLAKELHRTIPSASPRDLPDQIGPWLYWTKWVDGGVIHMRKHVDVGVDEILLDTRYVPNNVTKCSISDDHKVLAYLTAKATDEQGTLHILPLGGRSEADGTPRVMAHRVTGVFNFVWADGHRSIYYTRLDPTLRALKVYKHSVLDHGTEDALMYEEADEAFFLDVSSSRDKRYVFINCNSTETSEALAIRSDPSGSEISATPVVVIPRSTGTNYFVDHHGDSFYLLHNHQSPTMSLGALPSTLSKATWSAVQPIITTDSDSTIEGIELFRDFAFLYGKERGVAELTCFDFRTRETVVVETEEKIASAAPGTNLTYDTAKVRFKSSSPLVMDKVYEYDMELRTLRTLSCQRPEGINPDDFVVERVFVSARDGVQVPVTLLRPKSRIRDGRNPVVIRAYGAYGVSLEPHFRLEAMPLIRRGFIIALAHVRGGSEMGAAWYDMGRLMNKRNSMNDLVDVVEYLVRERWTEPGLVVGHGTSAGGMLVASAWHQRPDLFRCLILHVPFLDPLSSMLSATSPLAPAERSEWGDPLTSPAAFDYISSYAPYDNLSSVSAGCRTSMLVTVSSEDMRVPAWQGLKWVSRLRRGWPGVYGPGVEGKGGPRLLLRVVDDQGHVVGTMGGRLERAAVECGFILRELGRYLVVMLTSDQTHTSLDLLSSYPALYVSGLLPTINELDIANVLNNIGMEAKVRIERDAQTGAPLGTIIFRHLPDALRFYATVNGSMFLGSKAHLTFKDGNMNFSTTSGAKPIVAKHIPLGINSLAFYDQVVGFGPIMSCKVMLDRCGTEAFALLQFEKQDDAERCLAQMNGTSVRGKTLALAWKYEKKSPYQYPSVRPSSTLFGQQSSADTTDAPQASSSHVSTSSIKTVAQANQWGPLTPPGSPSVTTLVEKKTPNPNAAPWTPSASPESSPGYPFPASASGTVEANTTVDWKKAWEAKNAPVPPISRTLDARNLYVKNLEDSVDNVELFNMFRKFGRVISARVMRDEPDGTSRGFGFVSFDTAEQAARALQEMHGAEFGRKTLVVNIAEPKGYRQTKLARIHGAKVGSV